MSKEKELKRMYLHDTHTIWAQRWGIAFDE